MVCHAHLLLIDELLELGARVVELGARLRIPAAAALARVSLGRDGSLELLDARHGFVTKARGVTQADGRHRNFQPRKHGQADVAIKKESDFLRVLEFVPT